jgi:predicted transcriptional regulator
MDRPDLYVVARILERLWRENGPMVKTRLQVAARVNYDIFTKYLNWMLEKGLLTLENTPGGHEKVAITDKGMESYKKLVQWINEVIHTETPRR